MDMVLLNSPVNTIKPTMRGEMTGESTAHAEERLSGVTDTRTQAIGDSQSVGGQSSR